MATRKTYQAKVRFRRRGRLTRPEFEGAIRGAQTENMKEAVRVARILASQRVKRSPSVDNSGQRRYAKSMIQAYEARLVNNGRDFSLRNTTLRGRVFEGGSRAHPITARNGGRLAFEGRDGRLLRPRSVMHRGQQGRWPMRDAIRQREESFRSNILERIDREARRG